MVSFLPSDHKKKHKVLWYTTKFTVLILFLVGFYAFYLSKFQVSIQNSSVAQQVPEIMNKYRYALYENNTEEEENNHCSVKNITESERCNFVWESEDCSRYLVIHYCAFSKVSPIFFILMSFWVLILFYLLGDTAENYFVPPLTKMSEFLRLSSNVAGVTFLALGNGAPDLASIIVGVLQGSTGFGFGEPVGAGVFVTTVVLGLVSILSHVKVTRRPFLRDSIFYLLAVGYAFYLFLNQRVKIYESIICIVLYFIYVSMVVFGRMLNQWLKKRWAISHPESIKKEENENVSDPEEEQEWTGGWKYTPKFINQIKKNEQLNKKAEIEEVKQSIQDNIQENDEKKSLVPKESFSLNTLMNNEVNVDEEYFSQEKMEDIKEEEIIKEDNRSFIKKKWDEFLESIEWHEKKIHQKIFFIMIEWFFILLRNLTIFKPDPQDWNKWFTCLVPVCAPLFFIAVLRPYWYSYLIGGVFPAILIVFVTGLVFSFFIIMSTKRKKTPMFHAIFVIGAFLLSIFWLYIVARELLQLLSAFGFILDIPESILAITILAWGNSIGDLVSDIVVAREGYPNMAVGAIFGSPSLNLLIGLGIALSFNSKTLSTGCFPVKADAHVSLSFIFLFASLLLSIFVIPISKFTSHKIYGFVLIGIYVIYLILSILIVFVNPMKKFFTWNIGNGC